jgi:hypothetical protein
MDIPSNLITGLFTLLGTFLGSWLTSGRARHEKLWDVRREAYGVIASELGAITRVLDIADVMIAERDIQSYFETAARPKDEAAIHKRQRANVSPTIILCSRTPSSRALKSSWLRWTRMSPTKAGMRHANAWRSNCAPPRRTLPRWPARS